MQCFSRIPNIQTFLLIVACLQNSFGHSEAGNECELGGGVRGECVALPACAQYVALLKESTTTELGLRLTRERQCGVEGNNIKVCCPTTTEVPDPKRRLNLDDSDYVDELPAPGGCGRRKSGEAAPAVYNGMPVKYHEMTKWMALLAYKESQSTWECGGSIITERHVLTAAHCIRESLYVVRVGELDLAEKEKKYNPIDFYIKKKIPHEHYSKYHNDIAILILDGTIPFNGPYSAYLSPVCLPEPDFPYEKFGGFTNFITGWGETEKDGYRPTNLQFAFLEILAQDECKRVYSDKVLTIDERVFCAGDPGNRNDACNGDSGGPLIGIYILVGFPEETSQRYVYYYQLGVVSYGYRCSAQRFTGVYTNVTHFMPWIREKVTGKTEPRRWIYTTTAAPVHSYSKYRSKESYP